MEITIWLLAVWLPWQADGLVYSSLSADDYAAKIFAQSDRIVNETEVLDLTNCQSKYPSLKSCYLATQNPTELRSLSSNYLSPAYHGQRAKVQEITQATLVPSRYLPQLYTSQSAVKKRRRRRYLEENGEHSRSKRAWAWAGNPCTAGLSKKSTFLYAVDSETGLAVELLQDPDSHLYQTFFTFECQRPTFLSFLCEIQYVEFMAAVFTGSEFEVAVRQVKVPTHCALSFGWPNQLLF